MKSAFVSGAVVIYLLRMDNKSLYIRPHFSVYSRVPAFLRGARGFGPVAEATPAAAGEGAEDAFFVASAILYTCSADSGVSVDQGVASGILAKIGFFAAPGADTLNM